MTIQQRPGDAINNSALGAASDPYFGPVFRQLVARATFFFAQSHARPDLQPSDFNCCHHPSPDLANVQKEQRNLGILPAF